MQKLNTAPVSVVHFKHENKCLLTPSHLFQRNHEWNNVFATRLWRADRQLFGTNAQRLGDIGIVFNNTEKSKNDFYFSFTNLTPYLDISGNCNRQPSISYVSFTFIHDSLESPSVATLCSRKPVSEYQADSTIEFFARTEICHSNQSINVPKSHFGERLIHWTTILRNDSAIRSFQIEFTAVTGFGYSIINGIYNPPIRGSHKLRIDSIKTTTYINSSNSCSNPLLQFQLLGNRWEIIGLDFAGTLTILLSAFAAVGTVLGTRILIIEIFEWITKTWKSSTKKKIALFTIGYIFQTALGLAGLGGCLILSSILFALDTSNATMVAIVIILFLVFISAIVCWIITTVNFVRHYCRCCNKNTNNSIDENQNIDYIRLETTKDDSAMESKSHF